MDINGGQIGNQTRGNPIWPATNWTGPLTAGNVFHSDGTGNLAVAGGSSGQANSGYALMCQAGNVTQAGNTTSTVIVIPAQSQIRDIQLQVETAWTGNVTTFGVGTTGNNTFFTGNIAGNASALGQITLTPGNVASALANWRNVGNTDVQITLTSGGTGNGTGLLSVEYLQGINS